MGARFTKTEWGEWSGIRVTDPPEPEIPSDAPVQENIPEIPLPFERWRVSGFGAHEFVSTYWENEYNKNPSMDHLVVTIEMVFGDDKSVFVSTKSIETKSESTGKTYGYRGVIAQFPTIGFKAAFGSQNSAARSFKISIPNELVDALGIVRNGRILAGLAEISLQVDGGDYDERYVIMRGSMDSGVVFGDRDGEMLSVSVVDPKEIMSMQIPPYRVPEAWPYAPHHVSPFSQTPEPDDGTGPGVIWGFGYELSACQPQGGYSGKIYPPAAGVGKTYPIVWGYWPRVPCVPAIRDPHATSSEFGSASDEEYKDVNGHDKFLDKYSWWVVAYGHGHKFEHFMRFYNTYTNVTSGIFFSVPQYAASAVSYSDVDDWDRVPITDYPHDYHSLYFAIYLGGERTRNQAVASTSEMGSEWWPYVATLREVADPYGVPITVLRLPMAAGTDYSTQVQVSMISSLGSELDPSAGSIWSGHSVINAVRYFASSFTTLGRAGLDDALFAKAESRLGDLNVRGIVNGSGESSTASTLSFIEGQLLKGFPMVSMTFTGQGYGPIVMDRRTNITGEYIVGQWGFVDRVTSVQETPKTKIKNDFTMRYNYDFETNDYAGSITRNSGNSISCTISEEQCGRRTASLIESLWIWERDVAAYCIDWQCEHFALPSYTVSYACDIWMMFKHSCGDNIKITDERMGWDETVATILEIKYTGERVEIKLVVWDRGFTFGGGAVNFPLPNLEQTVVNTESEEPQG